MPATKVLAIVTLAAATLGTAGCSTCKDVGNVLGAVLLVSAVETVESYGDDNALFQYGDHHEHEHRCWSRR